MYRFLRKVSLHSSSNVLRKLVVFDIDGVVLRGDTPIAGARDALKNLADNNVPYAFLTNGCPCSENDRLEFLSEVLKLKLPAGVMFMSQTPFNELTHEFNKRMLVVNRRDPQKLLTSFKNICTLGQLAAQFPQLDSINTKSSTTFEVPEDFKSIEGVIFLDDPKHWETAYQLVLDVILTSGTMKCEMNEYMKISGKKQLPLYVASTDFLWVTEAPWQRITHGIFLHNLESTYKRLTGEELKYTAVYGKPNLATYLFLHKKLKEIFSCSHIQDLYFVGDNIFTDIYGANNFRQDLRSRLIDTRVHSLLVETGVYNRDAKFNENLAMDMLHKDTPRDVNYLKPSNIFPSIREAVSYAIEN